MDNKTDQETRWLSERVIDIPSSQENTETQITL